MACVPNLTNVYTLTCKINVEPVLTLCGKTVSAFVNVLNIGLLLFETKDSVTTNKYCHRWILP